MSASPPPAAVAPSQKRPLEEPSSPSGPGDQPDAKRPALDKVVKEEDVQATGSAPEPAEDEPSTDTEPGPEDSEGVVVKEEDPPHDGYNDTVVPDAPTADTQPLQAAAVDILSTQGPNGSGQAQQQYNHQDETGWLHMRAIISSAEAATVIGKGGENVTLIRRMSGAKCTVSDYTRGAVERILTVSGLVDAVAKVGHAALTWCPSGLTWLYRHSD